MEERFKELKLYNIETALTDLAQYQAQVLNSEQGTVVPVGCLSEYDYIRKYIYKLKADNEALNLVVDKLTAKEENKDKWVKLTTLYYGNVLIKTQDIDHAFYDHEKDTYKLCLKNKDFYYILRKESYEQLIELLIGKENE